jgi:hypothetical protein
MPSREQSSINPTDGTVHRDGHGQDLQDADRRSGQQSPAQLTRLADLVACGELPLPVDLHPDQLEHLVREVRDRRRVRLVGFIARAIALDIHQSREP